MEGGWRNSFDGAGAGAGVGGDSGGQNSNLTNNAWNIWDISTSVTPNVCTCYDWSSPTAAAAASSARLPEASVVHALLFGNSTTQAGWNSDPHMMCLKLGKRHYCEDAVVPDRHVTGDSPSSSLSATKRGKPPYPYDTMTTGTRWPVSSRTRVTSSTRCQVEGCHVALGNAKEYYRRHKVCEVHSKAPKVVVSGIQQRFCQQCSRFHDVTEFDEAKRSCRRRLEGHNLRRRKGSLSNSLPRNFPHSHENNSAMEQQLALPSTLPSPPSPSLLQSKPVCALSLLSSSKPEPWISSGDLSSRCSAALNELIVANRVTSNSGHFLNQNWFNQPVIDDTMRTSHDTYRFSNSTTMAVDVKQDPALDFGLLAMKEETKDQEEWTDYCWSAFGGANVV